MVDVRLITLIPPTQAVTQPSNAPNITTQGGTSSILTQLPQGTLLSGFILNRDPSGNPILRTEKGDVLFASNFFLKIGSEVVIRVQQQAGQPIAHLLSVNGLPPEVAEQQSAYVQDADFALGDRVPQSPAEPRAQQQVPTQNAAATSAPKVPLPAPGQTISAIIVTPPPAAPGTPNPALPGTSLLLSVLPPTTQTVATQNASPLAQLTSNTTTSSAPQALASLLPSAPAQADFDALPAQTLEKISTATGTPQPPSSTTSPATTTAITSAPNLPPTSVIGQSLPFTASNQQAAKADFSGPLGQTIAATVTAISDDGSATFTSPVGTLRIINLGNVAIGESMTLRVSSVAAPNDFTVALARSAPPEPLAPLPVLAKSWPALSHLTQLLGEDATTQIVPSFITSGDTLANAPGRIAQAGSQMLFFLAALKGGNFRDWIGPANVRTLEEKGYLPLLRKAEGEFLLLARQFAEPLPGQWQSAFVPIMANGELQQLRAFIKREKKKGTAQEPTGREDTRFVLEMDLSQLGAMQMDGLVKRSDARMQFDLVIRSLTPLPREIERDIHLIYTSTAELTGYVGNIMFQSGSQFPVNPMEDITPHIFDDVVV